MHCNSHCYFHCDAFVHINTKQNIQLIRDNIRQSVKRGDLIVDSNAQPHADTGTNGVTDVYSESQSQCVSQRHIISHHYTIFIIISN